MIIYYLALILVKMIKKTTKFETSNGTDVVNKAYLHTKLCKTERHISFIAKDCKEHKVRNVKKSEEVLIEKAVETTIQNFLDK